MSLTDSRKRGSVLEMVEGLPESGWSDIGLGEDATVVRHRPVGWEEQSYAVIRRRRDQRQTLLVPIYTVILVSRDDLPLDRLVRRHRGKQGQENTFKGPLIDLDLHHPYLRSTRADAVARGAVSAVADRCPASWPAALDPLPRSSRGTAGTQRLDLVRTNFRLDWLYHAAVQLE